MKFIAENLNMKTFAFRCIPGFANDEYNVKTYLKIYRMEINTELKEFRGVDLFIQSNKRIMTKD